MWDVDHVNCLVTFSNWSMCLDFKKLYIFFQIYRFCITNGCDKFNKECKTETFTVRLLNCTYIQLFLIFWKCLFSENIFQWVYTVDIKHLHMPDKTTCFSIVQNGTKLTLKLRHLYWEIVPCKTQVARNQKWFIKKNETKERGKKKPSCLKKVCKPFYNSECLVFRIN